MHRKVNKERGRERGGLQYVSWHDINTILSNALFLNFIPTCLSILFLLFLHVNICHQSFKTISLPSSAI